MPRERSLKFQMIKAANAQPGVAYRASRRERTPIGSTFYVLAPPRTAQRLSKRLSKRGGSITTDEAETLRSVREVLAGTAVMFLRHIRGTCPLTGQRWELRSYRALPLGYPLRALKRRPGYTTRKGA